MLRPIGKTKSPENICSTHNDVTLPSGLSIQIDQQHRPLDHGAGAGNLSGVGSGMVAASSMTVSARLPARTVMLSIIGLWACYFLITTLRGFIIGLEDGGEMIWRRGVVSLAGMGITGVLWLVLRLFDLRPLWGKVVAGLFFSIPAALLIAQVNQVVFASVKGEALERIGQSQGITLRHDEAGNLLLDTSGSEPAEENTITLAPAPGRVERLRELSGTALTPYFLLLAWGALYLALLAGEQARMAERRAGEFRRAAKSAELRSLRYQVNPHFLFNTLNSLSALVMTGKAQQAEKMIQNISSFYRHSLADDPTHDVSLAQEFELQRLYLDIEAVRFPDRLMADFDLPASLEEARVPGMILQPLVENSVKYGVAARIKPVRISIRAREDKDMLVVIVRDNGRGVPDHASHGFGIGLTNVADRIHARFGKVATLTSGPDKEGYLTEIRVPLVKYGL
ncbi:MAG: sensor histidine kinase [Sphingomonadaceae bacterium]